MEKKQPSSRVEKIYVKTSFNIPLGTDHLTCKGGGGGGGGVFVQNFFFGQHESFFFQNLILGYMTKTLNRIIIFFLHQNQNIFFSNIGNQIIFLEKKT